MSNEIQLGACVAGLGQLDPLISFRCLLNMSQINSEGGDSVLSKPERLVIVTYNYFDYRTIGWLNHLFLKNILEPLNHSGSTLCVCVGE